MVDKIEAADEAERRKAVNAANYLKERIVLLEKYLKKKETKDARDEIRHIESILRNINSELNKKCWETFSGF